MITTLVGPKKGAKDTATANGPVSNRRGNKVDTSDSFTPETGDEADDERLEGHSHPEEDDNTHHSAIKGGNEEKKENLARSPRSPSSRTQKVRLKLLADREVGVDSGSLSQSESGRNRSSWSSRMSGKGSVDGEADRVDDQQDNADSDSSEAVSHKLDTPLWRARMTCGKIVNNEYVQIVIISLIILNAMMMGIATMDFVTEDPSVDNVFDKIDRAFLVIFSVEVSMQLFYLGVTLLADGWLVFDLAIVVLSWAFQSLQIIRAFRIFRAFRLVTRVKPLRDLVLAIGAVLPRMYAIAGLLMLIFYIFSVLFTELFSELPLSENYFGTLDASLFTCMEMMTLEWGEIAREVMTYEPYAWAPFLCFIAITGFIVFNLIVAVVCDAVAVTEKTVRELDGLDSDDPGRTLEEAQERIELLQCHISDMQRTQQAVQDMIEMMAGELLHLETERMKAEHREAELRIEMERRLAYQKDMDSKPQRASLERNYIVEKGRRESERKLRMSAHGSHENLRRTDSSAPRRYPRRGSAGAGSTGGGYQRRPSTSSRDSESRSSLSKLVIESPHPPTQKTKKSLFSDVLEGRR